MKHVEDIADNVIPGIEIPSGTPLVYELDADLKPIPNDCSVAAHGNSIRATMAWRS